MGVICNSSLAKDFYSSCEPPTQSTCHNSIEHCTALYIVCNTSLHYTALHCTAVINYTELQCSATLMLLGLYCTEICALHCCGGLLLQCCPSFWSFCHNQKCYLQGFSWLKNCAWTSKRIIFVVPLKGFSFTACFEVDNVYFYCFIINQNFINVYQITKRDYYQSG